MTHVSCATVPDYMDYLVMQPDEERAVVRDLMFAVLAFNAHGQGAPLQISFPLYSILIQRLSDAACSGLVCESRDPPKDFTSSLYGTKYPLICARAAR